MPWHFHFVYFSLPAAAVVCTGPGDSFSCVSPWLWSYKRWWSTENTEDSHADLHHNEIKLFDDTSSILYNYGASQLVYW